MTLTTRIFAGYCIRLTPARSAAAYAHQVHRKAIIWGSNLVSLINVSPSLKNPISGYTDLGQQLFRSIPTEISTVRGTCGGTIAASFAQNLIHLANPGV
jgi:hypothetical protein